MQRSGGIPNIKEMAGKTSRVISSLNILPDAFTEPFLFSFKYKGYTVSMISGDDHEYATLRFDTLSQSTSRYYPDMRTVGLNNNTGEIRTGYISIVTHILSCLVLKLKRGS